MQGAKKAGANGHGGVRVTGGRQAESGKAGSRQAGYEDAGGRQAGYENAGSKQTGRGMGDRGSQVGYV